MFLRNKRAHPRKTFQAEGWIAGAATESWLTIQVLDISKGGFAFFGEEKLEIDSTHAFRLLMPGSSRLMNFVGRIRNCLEQHNPGGYRMSVQFKKIDVTDLAAIEWLVTHKP